MDSEIPGRQNVSAVTDTPEHAVSTQKAEARFTGGGALQHQHGGKGSDRRVLSVDGRKPRKNTRTARAGPGLACCHGVRCLGLGVYLDGWKKMQMNEPFFE